MKLLPRNEHATERVIRVLLGIGLPSLAMMTRLVTGLPRRQGWIYVSALDNIDLTNLKNWINQGAKNS